jgi:hypothetical protein
LAHDRADVVQVLDAGLRGTQLDQHVVNEQPSKSSRFRNQSWNTSKMQQLLFGGVAAQPRLLLD